MAWKSSTSSGRRSARAQPFITAAVLVAIASIAAGSAAANPYKTLKVKLLAPKVVATKSGSVYWTSDASQPITFKFSVTNTDITVLKNIQVRFVPGNAVRGLVTSVVPKPVRRPYFLQWTIKSLQPRHRLVYTVVGKWSYVSRGSDGVARISATAPPPPGINGSLTSDVTAIIRLR